MAEKTIVEYGDSIEVAKRSREVQLLQNVIEPDPEYQALFISDEATFFDICSHSEEELEAVLKDYFKGDLPASLGVPLWQFVDKVKSAYPGWPDERLPSH